MSNESFNVLLNGIKIGTTKLEYADPPMGVVHGKIDFIDAKYQYEFFKKYCIENNIEMTYNDEELKLIQFSTSSLRVFSEDDIEILSLSNQLYGMDSSGYDIDIVGIDSELFSLKFSRHIKAYYDRTT